MDFLGTFQFNLDEKKRLILPSKWRQSLTSDVILSKGYDGCLELRSNTKFQEYYAKELQNLDIKSKNTRILLRQFLGNAANLIVDKSFRILLPSHLLKLAEITRDVCLVGLGDVIEIWDQKKYDQFQKQSNEVLEVASENLK